MRRKKKRQRQRQGKRHKTENIDKMFRRIAFPFFLYPRSTIFSPSSQGHHRLVPPDLSQLTVEELQEKNKNQSGGCIRAGGVAVGQTAQRRVAGYDMGRRQRVNTSTRMRQEGGLAPCFEVHPERVYKKSSLWAREATVRLTSKSGSGSGSRNAQHAKKQTNLFGSVGWRLA